LLLAVAASADLHIWTRDITQAFTQAEQALLRDVFIVPPAELGLPADHIWRVDHVLYGLPESPSLRFGTYGSHHTDTDHLGMIASSIDPFLFIQGSAIVPHNDMFGAIALQVDDTLVTGKSRFKDLEAAKSKRFQCTPPQPLTTISPISFNGADIFRSSTGTLISNQRNYISSLPSTPISRTGASFATVRGKAAYATTSTRPDVTCAVNLLSQVTANEAEEADYVALDEVIDRLRSIDVALQFPKLDLYSLKIHLYADASFAGNKDLTSQLGFFIVLVDNFAKCAVIEWASVKSKRVCRSVLGAELYACAHGYDAAVSIKHSLDQLLGRNVDIVLHTDSRTLVDCLVTWCSTSERRLQIDIAVLRQAIARNELSNVAWIRTMFDPSDGLTRSRICPFLQDLLKTHILSHPIGLLLSEKKIGM
jgi:hypothetical protein